MLKNLARIFAENFTTKFAGATATAIATLSMGYLWQIKATEQKAIEIYEKRLEEFKPLLEEAKLKKTFLDFFPQQLEALQAIIAMHNTCGDDCYIALLGVTPYKTKYKSNYIMHFVYLYGLDNEKNKRNLTDTDFYFQKTFFAEDFSFLINDSVSKFDKCQTWSLSTIDRLNLVSVKNFLSKIKGEKDSLMSCVGFLENKKFNPEKKTYNSEKKITFLLLTVFLKSKEVCEKCNLSISELAFKIENLINQEL